MNKLSIDDNKIKGVTIKPIIINISHHPNHLASLFFSTFHLNFCELLFINSQQCLHFIALS